MSMEEIALAAYSCCSLWSVGYIFVDAIAIASQTLISELNFKKRKIPKIRFTKRTCVGNHSDIFYPCSDNCFIFR